MKDEPIRPQPKPESRAREKARIDRAWAKARRACVAAVWLRDRGYCAHCDVRVFKASLRIDLLGHVHEWPMRSAGNDGTDPDFALLLCGDCHLRGTHGWPRLEPVYRDPARGVPGGFGWTWRTSKVEGR